MRSSLALIPRLLASARDSWRAHRLLLAGGLGGAFAFCVLAAVASYRLRGNAICVYEDLVGAALPCGVMTAVSGFCMAGAGFLLLLAARHPDARCPGRRGWLALGGLALLFLAGDEVAMIHEYVTGRLAAAGVPSLPGFADQDVYSYLAYAAGALVLAWRLWPVALAHPKAVFPLLAMAACFGLSTACDLTPWEGLGFAAGQVLWSAEEIFKTIGAFAGLLWAALLCEEVLLARGAAGAAGA